MAHKAMNEINWTFWTPSQEGDPNPFPGNCLPLLRYCLLQKALSNYYPGAVGPAKALETGNQIFTANSEKNKSWSRQSF